MPTKRLSDYDRTRIHRSFGAVSRRALNSKPFPLTEEEIPEFGISLLEPKVAECYTYLQEFGVDLVRVSAYHPDFRIRSDTREFEVNMYRVSMPKDGLVVLENHPRYTEILAWAMHYHEIEKKVVSGNQYLRTVVNSCTSLGQIKRVLQDEIIRFVPERMQRHFAGAERQSRIPRGFTPDRERLEELANILAIGSLSPEEKPGVNASVGIVREI